MYGFNRQRMKQTAKAYTKYQVRKALFTFLTKTPAGWLVMTILSVILILSLAVEMLLDESLITDTLSKQENLEIMKELSDEVKDINEEGIYLISHGQYQRLLESAKALKTDEEGLMTMSEIIRTTTGAREPKLRGNDYFHDDEVFELRPSIVYGYYKYRQVKATVDVLKKDDLKPNWWQIFKGWVNDILNTIIPERRKNIIKGELLDVARLIKPVLLYVEETITPPGSDGPITVYVCVAAWAPDSMMLKEIRNKGSTIEKVGCIKSIVKKPWIPLKGLLVEQEKEPKQDADIAVDYIVNIMRSYEDPMKNADWMTFAGILNSNTIAYLSSSEKYQNTNLIPGEYIAYFQKAEKITGIPSWFLAAVAYCESSFNPQARADNQYGYAYGLMQVQAGDWDSWVKKFKQEFPMVEFSGDISDPYSQILIGSYVLYDYIKQATGKHPEQIDWKGDGWKEEIIPALAYYWEGPANALNDVGYEKCKNKYAPNVLATAESYKDIYSGAEGGTEQSRMVQVALSFVGTPYKWGGSSPNGFDCSGFVYYVFKLCGVYWDRMTANDQYKCSVGEKIDPNSIQPGDLIFFDWNNDGIMEHVGIYIGNGRYVEAHGDENRQGDGSPNCPYKVRVADLDQYHRAHMTGAKRIVIGTM